MIFAAIDAPGGFLFEWWSVFWDIFIARTNEKHSEVAASYIEVGLGIKMSMQLVLGVIILFCKLLEMVLETSELILRRTNLL